MPSFEDFIAYTNSFDWSDVLESFKKELEDGASIIELQYKLSTYQLRTYHEWLLDNFDIKPKDFTVL